MTSRRVRVVAALAGVTWSPVRSPSTRTHEDGRTARPLLCLLFVGASVVVSNRPGLKTGSCEDDVFLQKKACPLLQRGEKVRRMFVQVRFTSLNCNLLIHNKTLKVKQVVKEKCYLNLSWPFKDMREVRRCLHVSASGSQTVVQGPPEVIKGIILKCEADPEVL